MNQLVKIFAKVLNLPESAITSEVSIYVTPEWDSISHMSLISEIESEFSINFSGDEIALMQSFDYVHSIVTKKL